MIISVVFSHRPSGVRLEEEKCGGAPPAGRLLQPVLLPEGERGAAAAAVSRPQEQIQLQPIRTSLREALQRLRVQESRAEGADAELLLPLVRLRPPSTTCGGGLLRRCQRSSRCLVPHQQVTPSCLNLGASRSDADGLDRLVPESLLEKHLQPENMTQSQ